MSKTQAGTSQGVLGYYDHDGQQCVVAGYGMASSNVVIDGERVGLVEAIREVLVDGVWHMLYAVGRVPRRNEVGHFYVRKNHCRFCHRERAIAHECVEPGRYIALCKGCGNELGAWSL